MEPREHWLEVYRNRQPEEVSWYQPGSSSSLAALDRIGADPSSSLVDVGGGASTLVDFLLRRGWEDLTVVDIADQALEASMARLGARAGKVRWQVADVRRWQPERSFDVWHDRAVFHFLTGENDRRRYKDTLLSGTRAGSFVVMATFALDGPEKCSGLPVRRYDARLLAEALGTEFRQIAGWDETHRTPAGTGQRFQWAAFTRT